MWFRRRFSKEGLLLTLALLGPAGCQITDQEIRQEIAKRNGVVIEEGRQFPLEAERGSFVVDLLEPEDPEQIPPQDWKRSIEIEFAPAPDLGCPAYCWEQILREYLDDGDELVPITEFTELIDTPLREEREERQLLDEDGDPAGWAVDTTDFDLKETCDRTYMGPRFADAPQFGPSTFEENDINDDARLFLIQFETCLRCKGSDPSDPSSYIGCVNWFYLRVKGDPEGFPERTYIVTLGEADAPSDTFMKTTQRWRDTGLR